MPEWYFRVMRHTKLEIFRTQCLGFLLNLELSNSLKAELASPDKLKALAHQPLVQRGSGQQLGSLGPGVAPRWGWFHVNSLTLRDCVAEGYSCLLAQEDSFLNYKGI